MHVLYTNFDPGDGGGHKTFLVSLLRRFQGRHRLTLAEPAGSRLNRKARDVGTEAIDVDFPGGLRQAAIWRIARKLARLFESEPVDLVHVNGSRDHRIQWVLHARRAAH